MNWSRGNVGLLCGAGPEEAALDPVVFDSASFLERMKGTLWTES